MSRRIAANRVPERLRGDSGALSNMPLRAIWSGTSYPSRERFCCRATAQSQAQVPQYGERDPALNQDVRAPTRQGFGRAEFDTRVRQLVAGDQLIGSLIDCMLRARDRPKRRLPIVSGFGAGPVLALHISQLVRFWLSACFRWYSWVDSNYRPPDH
jgi:hypothetical protein